MYVGVYYWRPKANCYVRKPQKDENDTSYWTYHTNLNLKVNDKVIAPTIKEPNQRAIVAAVNVAKPSFQCREIETLVFSDNTLFAGGTRP